jgi:hypothetical protein
MARGGGAYAAPAAQYVPLQVSLLAADREREEKLKRSELAMAMEQERLKKAQLDRKKEEMVQAAIEGYLNQGQASSGYGPGAVPIDPNKPMEFSNVTPENRMAQGGRGVMGKALAEGPRGPQPGTEANMPPIVRGALFGNAFGEFASEKAAREERTQAAAEHREDIRQGAQTERLITANQAALEKQREIEAEREKRQSVERYSREVAEARTLRDKTLADINKQLGLFAGPSEENSRMRKLLNQQKADALGNYRFTMKNIQDAWRLQAAAGDLPMVETGSADLHPVELLGIQERLNKLPQTFLAANPSFTAENIAKKAKKYKKTPEEIMQAIEAMYQSMGGK